MAGHLRSVYELIKQHQLGLLRPSEASDPCRDEIEAVKITFEAGIEERV